MAGKVGRRVYKTKRWQMVRRAVFARDRFRCVKCGRRSGLECDHIERIETAGDWFAMDNLRTLCRSCHIRITAEDNRRKIEAGPRKELAEMAISGSAGARPSAAARSGDAKCR